MKHLPLVLALLAVLLPIRPLLASPPASDTRALLAVQDLDRALDQDLSALTDDLRHSRATVRDVLTRGQVLSHLARAQAARVRWLGASPLREAILRRVDLQTQRVAAILAAANVEARQGMAAARPRWDAELAVFNRYRAAAAAAEKRSEAAYRTLPPVPAGSPYLRFPMPGGGQVQLRAYYLAGPAAGPLYGQLCAVGRDGRIRWQGPRAQSSGAAWKDPLVFFEGDAGAGTIQAAGSLHPGTFVAIGTYPQSDVRAPRFRVLRWKGRQFSILHDGILQRTHPNTFAWKKGPSDRGFWIGSFRALLGDGTAVVSVSSGMPPFRWGTALVRTGAAGFEVVRWITPPRPARP